MDFDVRLVKGLVAPYGSSYQLDKAEQIHGIWTRTILLLFICMLITGVGAFYGVGNEGLSKHVYDMTPSEFELTKGLFAVGQVLQSTVALVIMIFLPSLVFWVFTDIEYKKLVVIQLFVASIFLIEKAVMTPLQIFFGFDKASSPFSLGVAAQYITNYEFLVEFFSTISIFSIGAIILQFYYLRITTEKSRNLLLLLIISINLFMWIITALFSYIKFEVLF